MEISCKPILYAICLKKIAGRGNYNPNIWFSGILLFFFLMAIAFMGYVLPFGQMSFWGATVITNLLSPFPSLIEWVCGGHYVYNPSLKRFFLFHFQFPFLLCGFRILHLFYLHFLSLKCEIFYKINNNIRSRNWEITNLITAS